MLWLWYSLASVLAFATRDILVRILVVRSENPRVFSFVFNTWGALFALLIFILQQGSFRALVSLTPRQYTLILIVGLLYGFYERIHFFVRKEIDASSFSILFRLSPVVAFVGALLFLQEAVSLPKVLGTSLIIGASLMLIYKNPKLHLNKALTLALVSTILLGLAWMGDKPASAPLPPSLYSFLLWTLPLVIVAFPRLPSQQLSKEFVVGGWRVALTALVNVFGYIWGLQALALADASKVIPVTSTSGVAVVVAGIVLLGERDHVLRKLIAGVIAFVGVLLLR